MSVSVRAAHASDIDWLLSQLRAADAHYRREKPYFSEHSERILQSVLEHGLLFISEIDQEPVGFIAGAYHPNFLNPDYTQLTALVLWVTPSARRAGAATALIDAFTSAGEESADWIMVGCSEDSGLPSSLFTDRGFLIQERTYLKEVV